MDGEKQVSPVRVLRLTASSLLGFTVALMPAAFGGSDGGSAKRTAEAVAGRAPGLVAAGDVRPRLGATRTATAATATSIPGARVAATLAAGTRVAGVPPVAKMVLDKVEATNRQLAANAQRMAAEAAAVAAEAVSRSISTRSHVPDASAWSTSRTSKAASSAHSGSESAPSPLRIPQGLDPRAATAVRAAYAQLGTRYVWGGTGRGGFDCSGLTQHVWGAAGVSIPRTSSEQARSGTRVSMSDIKPGDLVVFYGSQSHVGIYVGDGKIIHAPHPGTSVQIGSVRDMPVSAVVRY